MSHKPFHALKHPALDVEGCFGCKAASVNFSTVPGGARDQRIGASQMRQQEKDLHRYREKRRAGERPDGTTKAAMDASAYKQSLWERREQDIKDNNPPEAVSKVKRALVNKE